MRRARAGHNPCTGAGMRMRRSHRSVVALALLAAGCVPMGAGRPMAVAPERPGAALVMHGSAFDAAARDDVSRLVGEVTGRTVQTIAEEPTVERVAKVAAGRFDATVARAARADVRDTSCRKRARSVVTAVSERAEVIVRIHLDARTTTRPATDEERGELGRKSGLAGMLPGRGRDTLHETFLDGWLERTTFPGSTATVRRQIRWRDRRLGTTTEAPPPRVRDAIAPAFEELPAPAAARWDAVARALVTGGCPVLGDAVAHTFIDDEPTKRRIHAAALGVLQSASVREEHPSAMSMEPAPTPVKPSPTCEPGEVVANTSGTAAK
jgi:hypothetical protein